VPSNITGPTGALPNSVITINGKGLTGVFGVSFNGYPGTLVGGSIASITNTSSPIIITLPLGASTNGLVTGDTVTISNVIDLKTGKPATINRQWTVGKVTAGTTMTQGSFQLTGNILPGDNDPVSGGSWIDGTDSAVKVIVPNTQSNAPLPNGNIPTNPGPTGKIGVRNASGITYSSANFTIGNPSLGVSSQQQPPTLSSPPSAPAINNGTRFDVAVDTVLVAEGFATDNAFAFLEGVSSFESLLGSFPSGSNEQLEQMRLALDTSLIVDGAETGNSFYFFAGLEDMQNLAASLSSAAGQIVTAYEQDLIMALFLSGSL
jgi:hypothetical protein